MPESTEASADSGARLAALTHADFAPCVGQPFLLRTEERPVVLELLHADVLGAPGASPGLRQPFSLVFLGPGEPLLEQRIHPLEHAALGLLDLFLVPIGRDERGVRYESIFS